MLHGPLALRDSIRVLKNLNSFQHEKRNSVSPRSHVMFYLLFKHQGNTKPFHLFIFFIYLFFFCKRRDLSCSQRNSDLFTCEDNMLFQNAVKLMNLTM